MKFPRLERRFWKVLFSRLISVDRGNGGKKATLETLKPRPNDRNMPTKHIATLLGATCCVRLATLLQHVATCWVLLAQIWPSSNLSQQHPACRNTVAKRTQHVAPNNVAICCVGMLRSFGRGLRLKFGDLTTNGKPRFAVSSFTLGVCPYLGLKIRGLTNSRLPFLFSFVRSLLF